MCEEHEWLKHLPGHLGHDQKNKTIENLKCGAPLYVPSFEKPAVMLHRFEEAAATNFPTPKARWESQFECQFKIPIIG